MSNRRAPRGFASGDKVQRLIDRYQEQIENQKESINRLLEERRDLLGQVMELKGAMIITTCLLKQIGEPVVLKKTELEAADPSEVTVIEREDGGMYVRLEAG